MENRDITACIILIGNEILSGRTQDKNLNFLAKQFTEMGIALAHARVIGDREEEIVATLREVQPKYTYIFTTGGIGPTHDDITTECVAKAFNVPVIRHPEALRRLQAHYGSPELLNEARLKMADVPEGCALVDNPVSAAPGYYMHNVFVLAGVPSIMQAMFGSIRPLLKGGQKMLSRTVSAYITEGVIAVALGQIQQANAEVEIGSYPFMKDGKLGTSLVVRGVDEAKIAAAAGAIESLLKHYTPDIFSGELA